MRVLLDSGSQDTFPRDATLIDLLVGADQCYKLVQGDVRKGRPGTPIATNSSLVWLSSGPVAGSKKSEETTAMITVTKIESSDDQLKHFWELDAIGIGSHQEHQRIPAEEDAIKDPFSLTVMHRGRLVVSGTQKVAIRVSSFSGGEICFHLNSLFML